MALLEAARPAGAAQVAGAARPRGLRAARGFAARVRRAVERLRDLDLWPSREASTPLAPALRTTRARTAGRKPRVNIGFAGVFRLYP